MEKNHHILAEALQQLQVYAPAEDVWKSIDSRLQDEVLSDAINQMPALSPPESVWEAIDSDLSLQSRISQLAKHNPPEAIWKQIQSELHTKPQRKNFGKVRSITTWFALVAAVLVLAYFVVYQPNRATNIRYTEETIQLQPPAQWQEYDLEIDQLLNQLCKMNPMACNQPDFKAGQQELFYLDQQKAEILKRLNAYDQQKELQIMLTKIELEKNEIVKQMVSKLL